MAISTKRKGSRLLINGLNTDAPAEYISEKAATNVENFYISKGLLTKREGTVVRGSVIGGTDIEIMRGREFNREGALYNIRIGIDNIEVYNTGTSSWDDITGTALTGDADDIVDVAIPLLSSKRILCIANGIDNIRKYTGTGNVSTLGGSPPVAKFIQEYNTYLVCANIQGGTDVSQRVQWSETRDPETWNSGNAGSVDLSEDGEDITGLNLFDKFICVHKKNSIYLGYLVSTNKIFQFDRRETGAGTVANGSIVNLPTNQQLFLAYDGLRLFNGVSAPLIPSPINEEIRDGLNRGQAHKAWSLLVTEEDEAWIGIPIGSETRGETVYKYNYKTGNLYKDTRAGINTAWRATQTSALTWDDMSGSWDSQTLTWNDTQISSLAGVIHFGDTSGYTTIVNASAEDDNGTAIDAVWDSKDFKAEVLGQLLRFQEINIWAKGAGSLYVYYSTDEGQTWTEATSSPITLDSTFPSMSDPMRVYMDVVSQSLRVRFRHNGATGSVQIREFFVSYVEREII